MQRSNSWTKSRQSLKSFPPFYSQSPLYLCLEISVFKTHATSYNVFISTDSVKEKGGKPDRKADPLSYGLTNPYRNLKSENSHDYAHLNEIVRS